VKVGRNELCPCGSGKKFKKCCANRSPIVEASLKNAIGMIIGSEGNPNIVFNRGFVINQLRRDAPRIAQSFDRLCEADLNVLDEYVSRSSMTIYAGRQWAKESGYEVRETCGWLLQNALQTLISAIDILRDGFILQPGVLIRNLVETLIAVVCIFVDKDDWIAFRHDRLRPESRLAAANRMFPLFAELYGVLSANFVHIRRTYSHLHPIMEYESRDYIPLATNINIFRISLWLICVITELVFFDVSEKLYWVSLGSGKYKYEINERGEKAQSELFGDALQEVDGEHAEAETSQDSGGW